MRAELGDLGSEVIHASWTAPSCDAPQPDHTKETCGSWPITPGLLVELLLLPLLGGGGEREGCAPGALLHGAPIVGKRTTTLGRGWPPAALGLLGPVLGIAQQQGGLGLWGGCSWWAVPWGAGEGTGPRTPVWSLPCGTTSFFHLPNPLGLLKCATYFLKGLFLCLDHKIAREQ